MRFSRLEIISPCVALASRVDTWPLFELRMSQVGSNVFPRFKGEPAHPPKFEVGRLLFRAEKRQLDLFALLYDQKCADRQNSIKKLPPDAPESRAARDLRLPNHK